VIGRDIRGVGGLSHIAVQYAKAMGFQVADVDVAGLTKCFGK